MATIRVTLDMFSGRPNPVVELSGKEADDLLARMAPRRGGDLDVDPAAQPSRLGYRGLIIEPVTRGGGRGRGPAPMRLAGGAVSTGKRVMTPMDDAAEEAILGRAGFLRMFKVKELRPEIMRREIELAREWWRFPPELIFPKKPVCPCGPVYEPTWWNSDSTRRVSNNCYNYACNYRTDTFAQPGKANGNQYSSITGAEVLDGAVSDALEDSPTANNKCPSSGHLVALVIWPSVDFHWYRKGLNGRWTHKPGQTPATNLDNSGQLISDPRNADRGGYTEFTTFMVVKHGHTKIK